MITRTLRAVRQNIVAWIALFVALTGTSIAATRYTITSTGQIKPVVLKELHGARGPAGATGAKGAQGPQGKEGPGGAVGPKGEAASVKGEAGKGEKGEAGARGATGPKGEDGSTGPTGAKGETGATGEAGTALAYAHVTSAGEIETANSKNVASVKVETPEEGVYCISGLSFTPHNVVATIDANESVVPLISATLGVGKLALQCNSEKTQVTVETWRPTFVRNDKGENEVSGTTADRSFYLEIN
jgi:hypothetical protein